MTSPLAPYCFTCLQSFLAELERQGELRRISRPVSLVHEITEIHRRVLAAGGPALVFENPLQADGTRCQIPVVANLFGTRRRIEMGLGLVEGGIGDLAANLAELRSPSPPTSLRDAFSKVPHVKAALNMRSKRVGRPACQQQVFSGSEIDLDMLPIQTCWPGEPAPLVTWPMVITASPDFGDINVGIYRLQKLGHDRLIIRWLAHRGGAQHHRMWQATGRDMPISIAIGADPAAILAAVMPLPQGMSELDFSGMLRRSRQSIAKAVTSSLPVPANAEIVIEGTVSCTDTEMEGPYGDHTGYYNAIEPFPVVTISAITMRNKPYYLSTFTGRPPDEPSILGEAMTELFIPIIKRQFPEIVDLFLPPEACSYRAIVVSIDKQYPGQAQRIMMGLWSFLPQFSYTKLIIVVDRDIQVRSWKDVMWAVSTRFDASRDLTILGNTPIDYLDFASPRPGLGGKLGIDATWKTQPETERVWGQPLSMAPAVVERVSAIWEELGLGVNNGIS